MRQVIRQIKSVAYAPGQMDIPIPRTGYLGRIWVRFNGVLDNTGANAQIKPFRSPWELLQGARLNVNGNLFPLSADGYGYELLSRVMRPGYQDDSQMGGAVGKNTVQFTTPLAVTVTDENLTGIIHAGNPETTIQLELLWREATDPAFFTGPSATLTGTVEVWAESFLFSGNEQKPDISTLHNFTVVSQVLPGTGEQYITLPTLNQVYLRIIHVIDNAGSPLDLTEGMIFNLDIEDYEKPYTMTDGEMNSLQNYRYHGKVPVSTGARVWDMYWTRTLRDVVNSTGLSLFQSKITVPGGTTINAGAKIYTYIESLSPLN